MYETYYGLSERPFELDPDPRYLFLTDRHREALGAIAYGISSQRGITVLLGDAGTGKTTVIRAALANQPRGARCVSVNNPTLERAEFIELLAHGFKLSAEAGQSKGRFLIELEKRLRDRRASGLLTALVIDEAQCLSFDLLEEVRLLANVEADGRRLLPIVLAGTPPLHDRLDEAAMRQLRQRIAMRCSLAPLTLTQTAGYITARLERAGGSAPSIFTRDAVALVHEAAAGVPRTISVLCDNALVVGFAADARPVDLAIVRQVCRQLDLATAPATTAAPGAPKTCRVPVTSSAADTLANRAPVSWVFEPAETTS